MQLDKVYLDVDGLRLAGQLYRPGGRTPCPVVAICHGIPAHAPEPEAADGGYSALAERVCRAGLAAFIFNFRGAGFSGGNLDMKGWTRDLAAVIDYLAALPDLGRLSLLGFSGGAAVAVYVAARDGRVSAVATCACPAEFEIIKRHNVAEFIQHFRDISVIRDAEFPPSVAEWLDGFETVRPLGCVDAISPRPLLLVHGSEDNLVDIGHAHRLYDRAGEPKQLMVIEDAGHRLRQDDRAMTVVCDWLVAQNRV